MGKTAIEWATHVWNPFTGCDVISPGCAHCYAKDAAESLKRREQGRIDKARREGKPDPTVRYQKDGDAKTSGPGFGFTVHWDKLAHPQVPPAGSRVFVNSMSDVFHEEAPWGALVQLWAVFVDNPQVNWLVLTKRPQRMVEVLTRDQFKREAHLASQMLGPPVWPLPNVWLGVTVENRQFVNRADYLRVTPAAVRFISAEPLLGPLVYDAVSMGTPSVPFGDRCWRDGSDAEALDLTDIDWLIAGGESGPKHRRFDPQWAVDLRDACKGTMPIPMMGGPEDNDLIPDDDGSGTAFFMKQMGGTRAGDDLDELPYELQIREFPLAATI